MAAENDRSSLTAGLVNGGSKGQMPPDPLVLTVFPLADGQTSSYTLYEDSGNSRAYQRGEAAWTAVRASAKAGEFTNQVSPVRGSYPGMPIFRAYELKLPFDWPPEAVTVNGRMLHYTARQAQAGWRYEGNTLTTVVNVGRVPAATGAIIRIVRSAKLVARRAELDGYAGAMTRLREAYDNLNQTWPLGWSPDELIDAMQSGDRLSYRPESANSELSHYHDVLPKAAAKVEELTKAIIEAQGPILLISA